MEHRHRYSGKSFVHIACTLVVLVVSLVVVHEIFDARANANENNNTATITFTLVGETHESEEAFNPGLRDGQTLWMTINGGKGSCGNEPFGKTYDFFELARSYSAVNTPDELIRRYRGLVVDERSRQLLRDESGDDFIFFQWPLYGVRSESYLFSTFIMYFRWRNENRGYFLEIDSGFDADPVNWTSGSSSVGTSRSGSRSEFRYDSEIRVQRLKKWDFADEKSIGKNRAHSDFVQVVRPFVSNAVHDEFDRSVGKESPQERFDRILNATRNCLDLSFVLNDFRYNERDIVVHLPGFADDGHLSQIGRWRRLPVIDLQYVDTRQIDWGFEELFENPKDEAVTLANLGADQERIEKMAARHRAKVVFE